MGKKGNEPGKEKGNTRGTSKKSLVELSQNGAQKRGSAETARDYSLKRRQSNMSKGLTPVLRSLFMCPML